MKILFCASEVFPFAKTGGLADVAGALPPALEKLGCQVKVVLPGYRSVQNYGKSAKMGKNIDVYFIENEAYFDRMGLYGEAGGDYPDNLERFSFFCRQTLELIKMIKFSPEIIHCSDWQTALIPLYLKTIFQDEPLFNRTKTIFTIHNLAYQGLFAAEKFAKLGLDWGLFNMHALEFYGRINLLKAGLVFSRFITTVSPTYAKEIQEKEFGCGLDGLLRSRSQDLFGIINGLDYSVWDPAVDDKIFKKYSPKNLAAKAENKKRLQQELHLPINQKAPLLGIVTRLAEQKGIELIVSQLAKMARLDLQFVLLGTGDENYHRMLERIKQKGYKNISISLRFDAVLAHKIYAASDMFLMPSYYEPCGLGQLISFKYGTIPIVRKTGGLADTVTDYSAQPQTEDGFVFEKYSAGEMLKAIERAKAVYKDTAKWQRLMLKVMKYDFSWEASAKKYVELYRRALNE